MKRSTVVLLSLMAVGLAIGATTDLCAMEFRADFDGDGVAEVHFDDGDIDDGSFVDCAGVLIDCDDTDDGYVVDCAGVLID